MCCSFIMRIRSLRMIRFQWCCRNNNRKCEQLAADCVYLADYTKSARLEVMIQFSTLLICIGVNRGYCQILALSVILLEAFELWWLSQNVVSLGKESRLLDELYESCETWFAETILAFINLLQRKPWTCRNLTLHFFISTTPSCDACRYKSQRVSYIVLAKIQL